MSIFMKTSIWNPTRGKNGRWLARDVDEITEETEIPLPLGGKLTLFPGVLTEDVAQRLQVELCGSPTNFRQYQIQAGDEPRVHFLAHADATPNFMERQPSYKYAGIYMKSKPLKQFPLLNKLCNDLAPRCGVKKWKIGANPVLYRNGNDSMGNHADNDQEESKIMAVVVSSPDERQRRTVRIEPERNRILRRGDERYDILLGARDGYLMDGTMQQNYEHGVPKRTDNGFLSNGATRLVVVLRDGRQETSLKDSGRPCKTLEAPVKPKHQFGQLPGLTEGESYLRKHMCKHGFHHSPQGGVSGNQDFGCDALVVSGKRKDTLNFDTFSHLVYCVEARKGAKSLVKTSEETQPVRLFRSYGYEETFNLPKIEEKKYRYDGLYIVLKYRVPDEEEAPYCFLMAHMEGVPSQKTPGLVSDTMRKILSGKNLQLAAEYMQSIKIKGQDYPKLPTEFLSVPSPSMLTRAMRLREKPPEKLSGQFMAEKPDSERSRKRPRIF